MSDFQTIKDVWEYLDQIPMFGKSGSKAMNPGLGSIQTFLNEIGNPERDFKSIHIAGTNGKGTTARMLETVYEKAGYKTGVFTSPHLLKYNERIRLNDEDISDKTLLQFFQKYQGVLSSHSLTYFEISTTIAFWAFSEANVDLAIVEAGLGGRLDSTNVILPELSVITSIGLDHQAILGETKSEIASEKAGIIKTGVPVVIGNVDPESLKVIEGVASENETECFLVNPEVAKSKVTLQLFEEINYWNAATALKTVEILQHQYPVSKGVAIQALEQFRGIPARFEKLHPNLDWYFSGAHNLRALESMQETAGKFSSPSKVLVLSFLKDKLTPETLSVIKGFDRIFYFQQESERAASLEEVSTLFSVEEISESNALQILNELKSEVVIFAGSFYFYATVRGWLENKE